MAIQVNENGERDFSIELDSNKHWHTAKNENEGIIIEGTIGELEQASFVEPEILEVRGSYGILRIYLRFSEITEIDMEKNSVGDDAD
ncbi:MAG: hypothetical protein ACFFEF_08420 [Candidatus Thorarchaeota archaeon]